MVKNVYNKMFKTVEGSGSKQQRNAQGQLQQNQLRKAQKQSQKFLQRSYETN